MKTKQSKIKNHKNSLNQKWHLNALPETIRVSIEKNSQTVKQVVFGKHKIQWISSYVNKWQRRLIHKIMSCLRVSGPKENKKMTNFNVTIIIILS